MPTAMTLLKNATMAILHPASLRKGDVRISGGKIVESGTHLLPSPKDTVIDLNGKLLMPGFVNAHTHLYSSLARGMPSPAEPPRNFLEILQKIWWRLDRALDEESIYYSALVGAIDAARCGTTTLIDHHASPNCIDGSLDIIEEALQKVGIRGVLCYEVTDRGGMDKRDAGLSENERFLANEESALSRGIVGAHASFTLDDESLEKCGDLAAKFGTGVHIHVAEDLCDTDDARNRHGLPLIERLNRFGFLQPKSLLAHNIHLEPHELAKARESGAWLLHNPRSNMHNSVGHAAIENFGERSAIGTDGFPADMIEEAKMAFFKAQDAKSGMTPKSVAAMLHHGNVLAGEIFGANFGSFSPGAAADLVVLNYEGPTPMHESNLAAHLLFGLRSADVESVMVNGEWIIRDGEFSNIDVGEIYTKAVPAAKKLWQKMEEVGWD